MVMQIESKNRDWSRVFINENPFLVEDGADHKVSEEDVLWLKNYGSETLDE